MPLDPQVRALLDASAALGLPPIEQGTPDQARATVIQRRTVLPAIDERSIPGPAGPIAIRFYRPGGTGPAATLVYFHGGGWVVCSLDTHDGICRDLANASGCLVASIDYRLAPEHKFPTPVEDAYAATKWISANADAVGVDARRLAVGGDSAGGNLAAAVALMARDRGAPPIAYQLLIYPVLDRSFDTPSYQTNAEGYGLTRAEMVWFWNHYVSAPSDAENSYAAPLRAERLRGLPPALVITAEYDVLRDEGERYAERLRGQGVDATLLRYHGLHHGFFGAGAVVDQARLAIDRAGLALRAALS